MFLLRGSIPRREYTLALRSDHPLSLTYGPAHATLTSDRESNQARHSLRYTCRLPVKKERKKEIQNLKI